jgi:RNA polymerase sigma-70 factor (ECF subfamily)
MDLPHPQKTYLTSRSGLEAKRTVAFEEELEERDDPGPRLVPEAAGDRRTPEVNLIRLSDRAALRAAMEELTPHLLEVILLCDVEEMRYKAIAAVLDIPIGTVMSRIGRARAALRVAPQSDRQYRKSPEYDKSSLSCRSQCIG